MQLLHFDDSGRLVLTDFAEHLTPPYAILSHRWLENHREVHYEEVLNNTYASKDGYRKIQFCAKQAAEDRLQYFWIDTCCFDKHNIRERSEAVQSMFRWYQKAVKCYVFLLDVSVPTATDAQQQSIWEERFRASEWFTRAWTLQELIAPGSVEFFSSEGQRLGDKKSLGQLIQGITRVPIEALQGCPLEKFSISDRMAWAETRRATEPEDNAYCLLGIFNVQIPLTYGEGEEKALRRLQDELENSGATLSIIPFSRNEKFVGYGSQLTEVEAMISASKQNTRIAITGEGGTGKSQMALEIAYRIKEDDKARSVFWIDASDIHSIHQAYSSIAQKLNIPGWQDEKADVMQMVKLHLSGRYAKNWLLIFDNADEVEFADAGFFTPQSANLIGLLPESGFGSIIFTTTNYDIAKTLAMHNIIELHEMTPNAAEKMFEEYLTAPVPTNEKPEMKLLLKELSYLPLAIVQAAAYINNSKLTIKDYLSLSATQDVTPFQISSEPLDDKLPDYAIPRPVMITVKISLDRLRHHHPLAADFLFLAACVDRKDILLDFLAPDWSYEREDAVGILGDYALVTRRPAVEAVDLHRLVHLAVRKWIEKHGLLDQWTQKAIRHLEKIFPDDDHGNRSKWRRLLPHAKCSLSHGRVDLNDEDEANFIRKYAMTLYADGRYDEAEELEVQIVEASKKIFGADHLNTLASMNNIAFTHINQGRWDAAKELEVQILEVCKRKFGADHPNTLSSMANLASIYWKQGRWDAAEELGVQVLEIHKKRLGADHPDTLTNLTNLASIYWDQGRLDAAEEIVVQVLEIRKKRLGADHPDTLTTLANVATIYWKQGRFDAAEKLGVQALEIRKKKLGADHPDTLTSMNNLAFVWKKRGRDIEAIGLLNECVSLRTRVLGARHHLTLQSIETLAGWRAKYMDIEGFD